MALYAAYGSNMDPAQMLRRCSSSPHTGTGWIPGWRLTFGAEEYGWDGALATLAPSEDDAPGVFVALYDLTEADERSLDAWEGADHGLYASCICGYTAWPVTSSPMSTSSTRSRAACRRRVTSARSPTRPRPPAPRPTT